MTTQANDAVKTEYDLISMINHDGHTPESGHYVAICKHPTNHEWNCFNDAKVYPTDPTNHASMVGVPYILIYQRKKKQQPPTIPTAAPPAVGPIPTSSRVTTTPCWKHVTAHPNGKIGDMYNPELYVNRGWVFVDHTDGTACLYRYPNQEENRTDWEVCLLTWMA